MGKKRVKSAFQKRKRTAATRRSGVPYEKFVFEHLRRLFPGARVTHNDHVVGKLSRVSRQVDVSLRFLVENIECLWIAQCKDHAHRADIKVLGEFSAVVSDVGASKGLLVCSAGFARTNHSYARTLGIELLTFEDIRSATWTADITIPLIYKQTIHHHMLDVTCVANQALVDLNRDRELVFKLDMDTLVTSDNGANSTALGTYIERIVEVPAFRGRIGEPIDLWTSNLHIMLAGVWVPCTGLRTAVTVSKKRYLKYVRPDEYSQVRDHVRQTIMPLRVAFCAPSKLDASFVELADSETPVTPGLWVEMDDQTQIELNSVKPRSDLRQ